MRKFPVYRGLRLKEDDVIRREIIRHIRPTLNSISLVKNTQKILKLFSKELENLKF